MTCDHPKEQRWQYASTWFCCKCWRYFWGSKAETPDVDIYGRRDEKMSRIRNGVSDG